jgi:hypothetical protein
MQRKTSSIIGAVALAAVFTLPIQLRAQKSETINIKIEDYPQAYHNREPVKIIGLYLGTTLIKSGEDVQTGRDWLRDLRVMVKNVSDQPIRQLILYLDLPVSEPDADVRRIEIPCGRDYWYLREPSDKVPEILLEPGAVISFGYNTNNPKAYSVLAAHLQHEHKSLPSRGSVSLASVVFEDTDKGWYRMRYVMRTSEGWVFDPSKAHLNGGREKISRSSGGARALRVSLRPLPQCWDNTSPLFDATTCVNCPSCKYQKPSLEEVSTGWQRHKVSKTCFNTIGGAIDPNSPCDPPCCQGEVWDLSFSSCGT